MFPAQQDSSTPCWLWPSHQAGSPVSLLPRPLRPSKIPPFCCLPFSSVIHPYSFPLSLPLSSLDPPIPLSPSDWMILWVLDPEHGKGLHKYTIHHRRQGQLKPHDIQTVDFRCVCVCARLVVSLCQNSIHRWHIQHSQKN